MDYTHCSLSIFSILLNYDKLEVSLRAGGFEQTNGRSEFPFPLRFAGGKLDFVTQAFRDSPKLSSTGLATQ